MKLDGLKKYHFIGIGGVGMSALAKILIELGCQISGSDSKDSPTLDMLKNLGNVEQQDGTIPKKKPEAEKISAFGALSEYANPALIPFESCAWERAVVKKYAKALG